MTAFLMNSSAALGQSREKLMKRQLSDMNLVFENKMKKQRSHGVRGMKIYLAVLLSLPRRTGEA